MPLTTIALWVNRPAPGPRREGTRRRRPRNEVENFKHVPPKMLLEECSQRATQSACVWHFCCVASGKSVPPMAGRGKKRMHSGRARKEGCGPPERAQHSLPGEKSLLSSLPGGQRPRKQRLPEGAVALHSVYCFSRKTPPAVAVAGPGVTGSSPRRLSRGNVNCRAAAAAHRYRGVHGVVIFVISPSFPGLPPSARLVRTS